MIDADPQGSLTASLGYGQPDEIDITLATIMRKIVAEQEINESEGILHHEEGVDILPGNIELSVMELTMANVMSRELIMKEYVDLQRNFYDFIIIDRDDEGEGTVHFLNQVDEADIFNLLDEDQQEEYIASIEASEQEEEPVVEEPVEEEEEPVQEENNSGRLTIPYVKDKPKVYPNDLCLCGSNKKFKRCCKGKGIYD